MQKIIDTYYDINLTRTGLSKESDAYNKKAKIIKKIEYICLSKKIKFVFDVTWKFYDHKFFISATGTNYGIYITYPNNRFEYYIFENFIKNKKSEKKLDIDLKNEINISKYNEESKYKFNDTINGIAVLPNQNRIKNLDFNKLNNFIDNNKKNYIKIHPVISPNFVDFLRKKYGNERLVESHYRLEDIMMNCNEVAITSNTESIIPASLYNKKIYYLASDNLNNNGTESTYPLFYLCVNNDISIQTVFETDLTGLIPWSLVENDNYIINKIENMVKIHGQWRNSIYNCTV